MKRIIFAICFVFSISLTIKAYDYYDYYTGLDFSDSDVRYQDIDIKVSTPSSINA